MPDTDRASHRQIITETSFRGCLFFVSHIPVHKNATFYGQKPQKQLPVHEIDRFYGRRPWRTQWATCFRWVADSSSLRKTFGRQVYNMNSEYSELALVKLMELFNHSSVAITKRYLGLKQEEILETYDCLTFWFFCKEGHFDKKVLLKLSFILKSRKFECCEDNRQWHHIIDMYSLSWLFTYPLVWAIAFDGQIPLRDKKSLPFPRVIMLFLE